MTIPEKAVQTAIRIAKDDSHGYDQGSRWGNPDYDCSSLVITCYKDAGVLLTCTYTGNMRQDMLAHGFRDVTNSVNLTTGAGLLPGDVLLNEIHHTAIYIGNGQMVEATGNEMGKVTGGQPGDQTGREIAINPYHNYGWGTIGWDCVLRYEGNETVPDTPTEPTEGTYKVKPGDTLWGIATAHGMTYQELARINGIDPNGFIYPGQVLNLKADGEPKPEPTPDPTPEPQDTYTVKAGDSLWQIAEKTLGNGWSWYKLANENNIPFPYTIYPGQKLKIPKT